MDDYVKELQEALGREREKVLELEATIVNLKSKLKAANKRLAAFSSQAARQYKFQQDYLPYDDDERR